MSDICPHCRAPIHYLALSIIDEQGTQYHWTALLMNGYKGPLKFRVIHSRCGGVLRQEVAGRNTLLLDADDGKVTIDPATVQSVESEMLR